MDTYLLVWHDRFAENEVDCAHYPGFSSMMSGYGMISRRVPQISMYRISGPNMYKFEDPITAYDAWRSGLDERNFSAFEYDTREAQV